MQRSHKNSSGHSSPASTPTTVTNALPHCPPNPHYAPQLAAQSITTMHTTAAEASTHDLSHRVLPPKPSIPRPDPPASSSSAPLIETCLSDKDDGDSDNDESFYDTLQPREEEPQRESRIFPLHESRFMQADRPKYLHEELTERERDGERRSGRSRRAGSVKDASPALPVRSSASKLKRTSSADTVRRPVKKDLEQTKQRHASSSSSSPRDGSRSRGRSGERRSSDDHYHRNQSSSGDRTPSRSRHRSSEKGSSTSSSKGSPSPRESTSALSAMWKLLATPTSSRRYHSSRSPSKDSTSPKKGGKKEIKRRNSSSSKHDSSGSKD